MSSYPELIKNPYKPVGHKGKRTMAKRLEQILDKRRHSVSNNHEKGDQYQ